MLKNFLYPLPLFWILPFLLPGQQLPELGGARAAALGMGAVAAENIWAVQNNIGALGGLDAPTAAFAYHTRLHLQELTTFGAIAGFPLKEGVAAASFSRFGQGAYSLTSAGLGYSHSIRNVSIGLKVNYLQQAIEGYNSVGAIVLEGGGKIELLPKLTFGAHAFNLSQSSFSRQTKELIPVILKAGLEYLPAEQVLLIIQTLKEVDYPASLSTAVEYKLIESLHIRTGIQTKPIVSSFGFGFHKGLFTFDYAFRHHSTIGATHHLSITLGFPLKEKP